MKVEELKQKIAKREQAMKTFGLIERKYKALLKDIEEFGESCVVSNVTFSCPVEMLSFELSDIPAVSAGMLAKTIGESIDTLRRYIECIDDELKGIVEFEN